MIDIGFLSRNCSPKIEIFIFGILPRDKYYSVNRILIKEINTILKCKCPFHRFNIIEQEPGWTENNDTLDLSLFYQDKLHLIQKENIRLSESIITATEDANIGQNTNFNEMTNNKHGKILLSTVLKSVKFILSLFFSIFKYKIFIFFLLNLFPSNIVCQQKVFTWTCK